MIETMKEMFVFLAYLAGILILTRLVCGIVIGIVRYFVGRK